MNWELQMIYEDVSMDEKYMDAVKQKDMQSVQQMVNYVAKKNGYNFEAWHGTPNGRFNKFRVGGFGPLFFFAKEKKYAEYYAKRFLNAPDPITLHCYLKMENPKKMEEVGQQEDKMLAYRTRKEGFDSIETPNAYIVFMNEQIKVADPITYDKKGIIIPLSKRFDSDNDNIEY